MWVNSFPALGDSKAVVVNEDENKKAKNPYAAGRRPEGK